MGNIPLMQSREGARTAIQNVRGAMSSPDDFGSAIGRATQQLGGAIGQTAEALQTYAQEQTVKDRNEKLAIENASFDQTSISIAAREAAPADGSGVAKTAWDKKLEAIDKRANEAFPTDATARSKFRADQLSRAASMRDSDLQWEATQKQTSGRVQANAAIDAVTNRVRLDPNQFEQGAKDIDALIDGAQTVPAPLKEQMKLKARSDLAEARFDAGMASAKSVDDFEKLEKEIASERFVNTMDRATFDRKLDAIKTSKNQFMTAEGAKASAALSGMEARSGDRVLIPEDEMKELAETAKNAKSPAIQLRFQKVYQQQQDLRTYGNLPPAAMRQKADETKRGSGVVAGAVETAAQVAGLDVSIIRGIFGNEYSKADADAGNINLQNKAGASSARGLFQITDGTWLGTIKQNPGMFQDILNDPQSPTGIKPDAVLLGYRNDAQMQGRVMGAFTRASAQTLTKNGIAVDAPNMYMMHFLGNGGGVTFLRAMQANPNTPVSQAVNAQALAANRSVFYKQDGTERTVGEVYQNFGNKIMKNIGSGGVSQVQYERSQYQAGMADAKQKELDKNPIAVARKDGIIPTTQLTDAASFAQRGVEALATSNYYQMPTTDIKPFTEDEARALGKQLKEGNADERLAILASVQAMDKSAPGMAKAAMGQLDEKDTVTEHAAGLALGGDMETASKIMRGQDRVRDDKTLSTAFGSKGDMEADFNSVVGMSLASVEPAKRNAVFNAAKAHYAETVGRDGLTGYQSSAFKKSLASVLGGGDSVGKVNGSEVVLPKGVSGSQFDAALDNFTGADYQQMSVTGDPPRYMNGQQTDPKDIAYEGVPVWQGGQDYAIRMGDGQYLIAGQRNANGSFNKYLFRPSKESIEAAAARTNPAGQSRGLPAAPPPQVAAETPMPAPGWMGGSTGETGPRLYDPFAQERPNVLRIMP